MNKLIRLSKIISSLGFKEESIEILKLSTPLPYGDSIEYESSGEPSGTPESLTKSLLKKNLDLKSIFSREYSKDTSFFDNFTYIHFSRDNGIDSASFVRSYGKNSSGNPMEMSVVGAPNESACSIKSNAQSSIGGNRSFCYEMEGTPTSAFYYDATSSYHGQMNSPYWGDILRETGINPDEYSPKVINISRGKIDSFFYNKESYEDLARSGHKSDYHEIILKNAKVKNILVDSSIDKEEIISFFRNLDPYWIGEAKNKVYDIIFCSGSESYNGEEAKNKIISYIDSFFETNNDEKRINLDVFEDTFEKKTDEGVKVLMSAAEDPDVNLSDIITSANNLLKYTDRNRSSHINNIISSLLKNKDIRSVIQILDIVWSNCFSDDFGNVNIDFKTKIIKNNDNELLAEPIKDFIEPIFSNIKNNILNNLKSKDGTEKAVIQYIELLYFIADSGSFHYEANIKNRSFDYFLKMLEDIAYITELIDNNEHAKNILAEELEPYSINNIYSIQKYENGAKILTIIINILLESPLNKKEDVEKEIQSAKNKIKLN